MSAPQQWKGLATATLSFFVALFLVFVNLMLFTVGMAGFKEGWPMFVVLPALAGGAALAYYIPNVSRLVGALWLIPVFILFIVAGFDQFQTPCQTFECQMKQQYAPTRDSYWWGLLAFSVALAFWHKLANLNYWLARMAVPIAALATILSFLAMTLLFMKEGSSVGWRALAVFGFCLAALYAAATGIMRENTSLLKKAEKEYGIDFSKWEWIGDEGGMKIALDQNKEKMLVFSHGNNYCLMDVADVRTCDMEWTRVDRGWFWGGAVNKNCTIKITTVNPKLPVFRISFQFKGEMETAHARLMAIFQG